METNHRGFWALIASQFQGAFNDHAFKNMLILIALNTTKDMGQQNLYSAVIPAILIFPFVLFSMNAGSLADRYSKTGIISLTKFAEIFIMVCGALAFSMGNFTFAVTILFMMGIQAAYFGPSKYGILPELVPEKSLSWANGILELTTFLGIILGTIAGAAAVGWFGMFTPLNAEKLPGTIAPGAAAGFWSFSPNPLYFLIFASVIGWFFALQIPKLQAANPEKPIGFNPYSEIMTNLKIADKDRVLWLAIWGNAFFWFLSGLIFINIPVFAKNTLLLDDQTIGIMNGVLAVGIGFGSYAAGHLSGSKIEYGLIPLGAIFISIFSADLAWFAHSPFPSELSHTPWHAGFFNTPWHSGLALALLGVGAGFFAVPINALIQHRPDYGLKGGIQGTSYFLSNIGILGSSIVFYLLTHFLNLTPTQVFLAAAVLTIIATSYSVWLLPDSLLRLLLWILSHTLYKVQIVGRDNVPDKGGALFVANHLSFLDALFVIGSTDRFVRFIMAEEYYNQYWINPIARMMRVIPIAGDSGLKALLKSLRDASQSIRDGDVVCIFAEGQMTRTGQMLPFRRGFEKIMRTVDAPIIPIHLDRIWGSIFTYEGGKYFWKWPRRIMDPITVSFGKPMPGNSAANEVRRQVMELGSDAFNLRKSEMKPLHHAFVDEVRRHPGRFAMADGNNPFVSFGDALIKSILLAEKLEPHWKDQEMVGLLLPPSTGGACLNIAALLAGKIPVNINFTASQSSVQSVADQCKIKTVISSRLFLERIKITPPGKVIFVEDIASTITPWEKLGGWFKSRFYPISWLESSIGSTKNWRLEDISTVIFSSGSTGEPKGVMLSHYNIFSNLEATGQVLAVLPEDRIMGVLPFFHSFGFTGTLWFPLIKGFGVVYHPNPMDSRVIGALTYKYGVTMLVSTPTFLQAYMRRVLPEQFGSLKFVLVGAEKLTDRIARAFEEKFGLRPFECYGCTECSPAVTINIPGFRSTGFYQVGAKQGRIGHPLPGVSVRIVDPDSGLILGPGKPGLLLVKGPNIMLGYLGNPKKTAEVIKDGWYCTGDIAAIDEDGFITITDRLSRFAKIGGEMIPLVKVEEILHNLAGVSNQTFAVTSIPDDRKGERLVVLHILDDDRLKPVLEKLPGSGLPNLWIPRHDCFFRLDAIPALGTGKLDLQAIRNIAIAKSQATPVEA